MAPDLASEPDRIAVVLAAGQGKRMRSALPKVLHEVAGRPMLARVLATARLSGCDRLLVVVGHRAESVRAAFPESDLTWVEQREQRGTGHALLQAAPHAADRRRCCSCSPATSRWCARPRSTVSPGPPRPAGARWRPRRCASPGRWAAS